MLLQYTAPMLIVGIAGYFAFETVRGYARAEGSTWDRLVAAFRHSATIFWARVNALSAAAVAGLVLLSDWLAAPGLREALQPYLSPEYMLAYTLVLLIGSEISRRRTL